MEISSRSNIRHATYLRNRVPTRALDGKTPKKSGMGRTAVWIFREGKGRSKLLPRSKKFVFVGFEDGPKAVRHFDASPRKIKVSRNFIFSESGPQFTEVDSADGLQLQGESGGASDLQPSKLETPVEVEKLKIPKLTVENPPSRSESPALVFAI